MSGETAERSDVEVPEEWQRIGFSGLFHIDAAIKPEDVELWQGRVPCMVNPLGGNTGWLALRVNDTDPPTITVVRKDGNAIGDLFTGRVPKPLSVVSS